MRTSFDFDSKFEIKNCVKMNVSEAFVQPAYFNAIDYSILISTLVASLAIGIYFGFFSKSLETTEDYLVGGHKMKVIPIAISLVSRWNFNNSKPLTMFIN